MIFENYCEQINQHNFIDKFNFSIFFNILENAFLASVWPVNSNDRAPTGQARLLLSKASS